MTGGDRALVFGADSQIGLSVVRELHQHGVEVFGVAHSRRGVGLFSRAMKRGWVLDSGTDAVTLVNQIAKDHDIPFLLAVGESDIQYFNAHRRALSGIRPLIPEPSKMAIVLDKARVAQLATEIGIEVPVSYRPTSAEHVDEVVSKIDFPVVLKWSNPFDVNDALDAHGLTLHKKLYCYDATGLSRELHQYDPIGRYPMVQSFASGHGVGHMVFMADGEPVLRFCHRRIHEWPPDGGSSSLCESEPPDDNPALLEQSVALLRRIGWEGPAMVEYREDPSTGRAVLMEINGRFWGSMPLCYHAGAPFAWLTYAVLGKGTVPEIPPYRAGIRCGFIVTELKRLHQLLVHPEGIGDRSFRFSPFRELVGFVIGQLDPRRRHFIFELRDPLPAIADVWFALKSIVFRGR